MKIKITTERLPDKFPKGEIYEVEELTGCLYALVRQNEAEVIKPVEQIDAEALDYREEISEADAKKELRAELKAIGVKVKGNPKLETLEKMMEESKKK